MRLIFCFLICLSTFSVIAKSPKHIDISYTHIVSSGYWSDNGKEGFFRFITQNSGYEHVSSKLYVQWILYPSLTQASGEIISEITIKEFDHNFFSFDAPECILATNCKSFTLKATHLYANTNHHFIIKLGDVAKYSFSEVVL